MGWLLKERGNYWLRFLDRYVGIPILYFLSAIKRTNRLDRRINSILVIKLGTIGDTLLLIPVLKSIKDTYPGVSITVIGSKNNFEVLNRYSFIDNLNIFKPARAIKEPFYFLNFIKEINNNKYDIVIDFEPWPRISSILTFFIKTGYKIGFKTEGEFRHFVFDSAISHSSICHEINNYISLANALGRSITVDSLEFPIYSSEKDFVEDLLRREGVKCNNLIIFHPWSSGYKGNLKEWSIENFKNLAKLLVKQGFFIGVTGTKDNKLLSEDIVKACPKDAVSFCGIFTLGQTAYLIKKSRLLITVNTGIMHLGTALNHPMITLNGPASILRWGPIGSSNVHNLESDFTCAPCLNLGFEYKCKKGGCVDAIKVETVAKKVSEIIKRENLSFLNEEIQGIMR